MKSPTHRQSAAATQLLTPFRCHSLQRRTLFLRLGAACLSFFLAAGAASPAAITVAAAADLKFALQDMAAQYEKQTGNTVSVTYGSSGNFYAQIQNGAPFDLFFSADLDYPRQFEAAGLAESGTLYQYGVGRLVLWVPANSPVDVARRGWDALRDPAIRKIAIANPTHAPYGRAAVAALKSAGIYDQITAKLVYGENISQAAQFVESGNADAGLLALALALSPHMQQAGKFWSVPAAAHPPLQQAAIMLKSSPNKKAARAFLEFVKSPAGRAILEKHGFSSLAPAAPPAKTP
ncbi:MAG: molybdate ABC transporter substrate-binding protein [Acidobacteriia bacterium]|nr:molybdate ABC transporter substrate-binding protein [Terriglobia bacterium]